MTDPGMPAYVLRPLMPEDEEFFRLLESVGDEGVKYRLRGMSLPSDGYHASLWAGVLVQLVVSDPVTSEPWGLVCCYGADLRNGHARIATIFTKRGRELVWPLLGISDFIDHVLRVFPLRKLYADVIEFNAHQFSATFGREWFREEGRLVDHEFHDGRYWDMVVMALHRADWESFRAQQTSSADNAEAAIDSIFRGLGLDLGELPDELTLEFLGIDSLTFAEIVDVVSTRRGLGPGDGFVDGICTVGDLRFLCAAEPSV